MTGLSVHRPSLSSGRNRLEAYIDGWRRHDIAAVLETLTNDCVVIECYVRSIGASRGSSSG